MVLGFTCFIWQTSLKFKEEKEMNGWIQSNFEMSPWLVVTLLHRPQLRHQFRDITANFPRIEVASLLGYLHDWRQSLDDKEIQYGKLLNRWNFTLTISWHSCGSSLTLQSLAPQTSRGFFLHLVSPKSFPPDDRMKIKSLNSLSVYSWYNNFKFDFKNHLKLFFLRHLPFTTPFHNALKSQQ